jgi:hypothetical protein
VPTPDEARARPARETVPTYRPAPAAPRPAPAQKREEKKDKK